MLDPTEKDIPRPGAEEKPQYDGRRGEITIGINPIPARDTRGLRQDLCTPGDPTETEPDLPLSV